MAKKCLLGCLLWLLPGLMLGQERLDSSIIRKIVGYVSMAERFGLSYPQEKVYAHMDNTSYYQGDNIWFQCYVVNAGLNNPTALSKTLYVELLNPGGTVVSKLVLPIKNGRAHGNFALTQLPFYSGFYELRAYTKYMLNFGEATVFSRIFPVFEKPKVAADYAEKTLDLYNRYKYPQERRYGKKGKKVNVKFYPEGGSLISGVENTVAFEATDAYGNPIDVKGRIVSKQQEELARLATLHEGRGVFSYTPSGEKGDKAVVTFGGRQCDFDLPVPQGDGIALHVNNLSDDKQIRIQLQKSPQLPPLLVGLALMSGGQMREYRVLNVRSNTASSFLMSKDGLPAGVAQLVLFDATGKVMAVRPVFVGKPSLLNMAVRKDKRKYMPFEQVKIDISLKKYEDLPQRFPLSVSVRDGREEVENHHSILTDLLLMSDIKGYVRNPAWYFEADDPLHRAALDQLLMVQGWQRYDWNVWSGTVPFDLKYYPEQGIEVHGKVVSFVKGKPKADVDVSSFLTKRGEDSIRNPMSFNTFRTDSLGRFAFRTDVEGKWNLILSVAGKGKRKDYRILLDKVFSPVPRSYSPAEMQVEVAGKSSLELAEDERADSLARVERFGGTAIDSLARLGIKGEMHHLKEVVVKAKKYNDEANIFRNRSRSIAYYDVASERDEITDRGGYIGDDIHELMMHMNKNFYKINSRGEECLGYIGGGGKGTLPLFVVNYQRTYGDAFHYFAYKNLPLNAIKSIYLCTDPVIMCQYADPGFSPLTINDTYACAVFIETYPEEEISVDGGKGTRKAWIDGYSPVKAFYHPDYKVLPKEPDYRRTLYWNPCLMPDEKGVATVRFYNNSSSHPLKITIETLADDGTIGTYNE